MLARSPKTARRIMRQPSRNRQAPAAVRSSGRHHLSTSSRKRVPPIDDIIYDVTMYRLVLETDVMVAALDSPAGASRQLLLDVLDGKVALLLSASLIREYQSVLT